MSESIKYQVIPSKTQDSYRIGARPRVSKARFVYSCENGLPSAEFPAVDDTDGNGDSLIKEFN